MSHTNHITNKLDIQNLINFCMARPAHVRCTEIQLYRYSSDNQMLRLVEFDISMPQTYRQAPDKAARMTL